jgi:hypothetical protein
VSITLITPTGGRPEAFKQCEKYISRQSIRGSIQWIVVDDCNPPTKCTMGQEYIQGPMPWQEGINTQRPNMDAAFNRIKGEYIFVIEDDDWYSFEYLEMMQDLLKDYSVCGEGNAKYYHVGNRTYLENGNTKHVSLCQTGLRKGALPLLYKAIHSGELYIDIKLWGMAAESHVSRAVVHDAGLVVGIKGMPGRGGIGLGHKQKGMFDVNGEKLKSWVGEDAEFYKGFYQNRADKLPSIVDTKVVLLNH